MRKITITLGAIVVLLSVTFLVLRTPDSNPGEMLTKYGGDDSRFADTASGMSVHYRDQGCRDCPAIVLVHGSNSSLHAYETLVRILEDKYRLVSYDQPGHGLTGPHPLDDYSAQGMFEAIDAVVDATGIDKFAITGHSMGGWVAWRYALERPDQLSALILISASGAPPSPEGEKPRPYLGARIMRHPVGRFLGQHITPRYLVEQSLFDSIFNDDRVTEKMVDRYWELLRLPGNRRAAGLLALVDREPEYGQRLSELTLPTLVLWGEEDLVVPPHNATTFDDLIPDSDLRVFKSVGHVAMEEAPDHTAEAIDDFLSKAQ